MGGFAGVQAEPLENPPCFGKTKCPVCLTSFAFYQLHLWHSLGVPPLVMKTTVKENHATCRKRKSGSTKMLHLFDETGAKRSVMAVIVKRERSIAFPKKPSNPMSSNSLGFWTRINAIRTTRRLTFPRSCTPACCLPRHDLNDLVQSKKTWRLSPRWESLSAIPALPGLPVMFPMKKRNLKFMLGPRRAIAWSPGSGPTFLHQRRVGRTFPRDLQQADRSNERTGRHGEGRQRVFICRSFGGRGGSTIRRKRDARRSFCRSFPAPISKIPCDGGLHAPAGRPARGNFRRGLENALWWIERAEIPAVATRNPAASGRMLAFAKRAVSVSHHFAAWVASPGVEHGPFRSQTGFVNGGCGFQ